jgi:hypothetical protein
VTALKQHEFIKVEPTLEALCDEIDRLLEGNESAKLRELLVKLGEALGESLGVSLRFSLDVVDWQREQGLSLLQTGVSVHEGETHRTYDDASVHRYLVNGEIEVVPHDRCPICWQDWAFKFENRECPHCEAALGKNVRLLIDGDVCPFCEQGTLTSDKPKCDRCGFELDPATVYWG